MFAKPLSRVLCPAQRFVASKAWRAARFPAALARSRVVAISSQGAFSTMKPTLAEHADHAPQPDTHVAKAQEWFLEGNRKWNEEDIHGALECFMKSVESHATGDAFYNIANCHLQLGNYLDAQTAWEKSIELSPKRADAHVNLANVYALVLKETAKALPIYEEALRLEPTDGDIRFNYAAVLDSAGQLEKAIEQYKLAIDNGCKVAEKNLRNALARQLGKHLKESEGSDK